MSLLDSIIAGVKDGDQDAEKIIRELLGNTNALSIGGDNWDRLVRVHGKYGGQQDAGTVTEEKREHCNQQ